MKMPTMTKKEKHSVDITLILPIVILVAFYYFAISRPQKKKKQAAQEMKDNLKCGDIITTIGGFIGAIVHISDDSIVIETGEDRVRIHITKWAVANIGGAIEQPKY